MLAGFALALVAVVLTGAMSGIFLAFSFSVMPGLDRLPAAAAVTAMRAMNSAILTPVFFVVFFGAPVAAGGSAALWWAAGHATAAWLMLGAALAYLLGVLAPTAVVNVPLNNALAAGDDPPGTEQAPRRWAEFAPRWRRWNAVRGVCALLGLALAGAALLVL